MTDDARAQTLDAYSRARLVLTARERLGLHMAWSERPDWMPLDFGEEHMAVLAQRLREVWGSELPPPWAPVPPASVSDEDSGDPWSQCCPDQADAVIAFVDRRIRQQMGEAAAAGVRSLLQWTRRTRGDTSESEDRTHDQ